jgi:hypothetical protein
LITLTFHAFFVENNSVTSDQHTKFSFSTLQHNNPLLKPSVVVMIPARKGLHKRIEEKAASALRALESGNPTLSLRIFIFDKVVPRSSPNPPLRPRAAIPDRAQRGAQRGALTGGGAPRARAASGGTGARCPRWRGCAT